MAKILLALALLTGLGLAVAPATTARADCSSSVLESLGLGGVKEPPAPAPVWPNAGIVGMVGETPDLASVPDTAPDPFTDKNVSIASVYGHQYGWGTYDLGCIPDAVATAGNSTGSMVMGLNGGATQLLQAIDNLATKGDLSWLHHAVAIAATSLTPLVLGDGSTLGWLPLALLAAAIIVGWRAPKASYADAMQRFGIAIAAIAACVASVIYPAQLSRQLDNIVTGISTTATASAGKSMDAADLVARSANYKGWLTGEFGDATSPTATKYGPIIFEATHYSWSDVKKMTADPGLQKSIADDKAKRFRAAAKEIKDSDPAAYANLQGHGDRVGPAIMSGFTGFLMSLFVFCAKVIVAVCRVMMPALVIAAAFIAMMGMLRGKTGTLMSLWDMFSASVVETAKQSLGAVVMVQVLSALVESNLSGGATIFWMIVATIVGFAVLKPVRAIKSIVPGLDPGKSYVRSALSSAASAAATYVGARKGAGDGVEGAVEHARQEQAQQHDAAALGHDTHSLPALEYVPQETQTAWRVQQVHPETQHQPQPESHWAGIAPSTSRMQSLPAGASTEPLQPGGQRTEIPQRTVWALEAGPTQSVHRDDDTASLGTSTPPVAPLPSGPAPAGAIAPSSPTSTQTPATVHVVTTTPELQGDAQASNPQLEGGHTVTEQPAQGQPVQPVGMYGARPTSIYTAETAVDGPEVEIWETEPVIDENGVEHYEVVLYNAADRAGAEQ